LVRAGRSGRRGLGMGDIVLDRWSGVQSGVMAAHGKAIERGAAMHAISKFARLGVQTCLMGVGAWLAIEREISPGAMMAASIIMGRALAPVEQAVGQRKRVVAFRTAYQRLEDLFQALPAQPAATLLPDNCAPLPASNTAQSIELMLKSESFDVYTTNLGEEGVDLRKLYEYDIILLALNLPDMSGFEVLRASCLQS
jgi:ABC-type protease/lipase transport system fused ATPase/permease subunit